MISRAQSSLIYFKGTSVQGTHIFEHQTNLKDISKQSDCHVIKINKGIINSNDREIYLVKSY